MDADLSATTSSFSRIQHLLPGVIVVQRATLLLIQLEIQCDYNHPHQK